MMLDGKKYCTRGKVICKEVNWFHKTSIQHRIEEFQWNEFHVMDIKIQLILNTIMIIFEMSK